MLQVSPAPLLHPFSPALGCPEAAPSPVLLRGPNRQISRQLFPRHLLGACFWARSQTGDSPGTSRASGTKIWGNLGEERAGQKQAEQLCVLRGVGGNLIRVGRPCSPHSSLSLPLTASLPMHTETPTHPSPEQTHESGGRTATR